MYVFLMKKSNCNPSVREQRWPPHDSRGPLIDIGRKDTDCMLNTRERAPMCALRTFFQSDRRQERA